MTELGGLEGHDITAAKGLGHRTKALVGDHHCPEVSAVLDGDVSPISIAGAEMVVAVVVAHYVDAAQGCMCGVAEIQLVIAVESAGYLNVIDPCLRCGEGYGFEPTHYWKWTRSHAPIFDGLPSKTLHPPAR